MSDALTALVVGVGEATGRSVCERLAARGDVAMVARSTGTISTLSHQFLRATAYQCDITDRLGWQETLSRIVENQGMPDRILFNTEGGGWGEYNTIKLDQLGVSFDVNAVALLALVQTLFPEPDRIEKPCRIVVSTSPAAYVSDPFFLGIAPSRAAQRVICETLNQRLSDRGVTFGLLSIAGAIDEPKMRAAYPNEPSAFFIQPGRIADRVMELFDQPERLHAEIGPELSASGR